MHYQPLWIRAGQIAARRRCARAHTEMGWSAGEFIPGRSVRPIVPIGRWCSRRPLPIRIWQEMGYRDLSVAVNLSTRQFLQSDLVQQVSEALASSAIEPTSLDLEITETNAMQNAEVAVSTLWDLKKVGVSLSMDDFGTGYSSLNYLTLSHRPHKIDRSSNRLHPARHAAIAAAVIAMAHSLKLGGWRKGSRRRSSRVPAQSMR